MTVNATLSTITIDCADPRALVAFYQNVTGWTVGASDDDSAVLGDPPMQIAFQRVAGYQAPKWPDAAAQVHLARDRPHR